MRPHMRFVPIKTEEQQAAVMPHKARDLLVRPQTMLSNAIRGHMAELGMTSPLSMVFCRRPGSRFSPRSE
jgi:transposase